MFEKAKYIFRPSNAFLFFGIAFVFQLFYLITFKTFDSPDTKGLYFLKGDGYQYVEYCENLYKYGTYFEGKNGIPSSYTSRMPGMSILYLPIRLLFNQNTTLNLVVLFQALFAALASYFIALIALKSFKSNSAFYLSFILYATCTIIANFNHRLYSESQALSTIVFAYYFFFNYLEKKQIWYLLLSSLCLIWCVFLRPFVAPFIVIATLYLFYLLIKRIITLKHVLIFILPVFICFGTWTYRNYHLTKLFIPLQTGWEGSKSTQSLENFIETFGLGWIWWDPTSEHTWFMDDQTISFFRTKRPDDSIFDNWYSKHIFSKELTIDTLKKARFYYWQSNNDSLSLNERDYYTEESSKILDRFVLNQQETHPFLYYFGYRIKLLQKHLNHRLGAGVFSYKYPLNVVITFLDAIANSFIFTFGFISLLLLLFIKKYRTVEMVSIILFPTFILVFFSFYLRNDESRFITMAVPFLLLCGVQGFEYICSLRYKYIYLSLIGLYLLYSGIFAVTHFIRW